MERKEPVMADNKGMEYLRRKLLMKQGRVETRYKYYEMKNKARDFGISTPPNMQLWNSTLGWCAKAVDSLSDRLSFREFRNDVFNLNEIFAMNNPDVFFDSAILSALIGSCSFVYISPDEDGYPRLQVIDGANATGRIDEITGLLTEGYAVLQRDQDTRRPTIEAHFEPFYTTIYRRGEEPEVYEHNVEHPLLVPIIYRPDAKRPFGHSRISRSAMSLVGSALRTIKRAEVSAEFYSYPQKYAVGMSDDAEMADRWKASMSSMLTITKDEDNDHPVVGQFQQQSMTPHTEQLKMFAALFGGEMGLTMDDLGFPSDNPSSSEAIKAAHETLRATARKAQKKFGSGFLNVGYLAACLRDDWQYSRRQFYMTKPIWEQLFEPDMSQLSLIGDGAIKVNQAVPGYFGNTNLRDLTGIESEDDTNE